MLRTSLLLLIRNTVNGDPRWCCTYLLDPSDPLFVELGAAYIKQQIKGVFIAVRYGAWLLHDIDSLVIYPLTA